VIGNAVLVMGIATGEVLEKPAVKRRKKRARMPSVKRAKKAAGRQPAP
jgi:hypothetical protein